MIPEKSLDVGFNFIETRSKETGISTKICEKRSKFPQNDGTISDFRSFSRSEILGLIPLFDSRE